MANLNIICKSDKCDFVNYFSEPLVFPKNAEISLVKANLTVPVLAQQQLVIPLIPVADRTDIWIEVVLDGIEQEYSWTDLYTAYAAISGLEQFGGVPTANSFFSGDFVMFTNNPLRLTDTGGAGSLLYKTSFQEVFAKMVDTDFVFYNVSPYVKWVRNETEVFERDIEVVTGTTSSYAILPATSINWGITSLYNPAATAARATAVVATDANYRSNWTTPGAGAITSAASANVSGTYDNIFYDTNDDIDPNGGYWHFNKNVGGTHHSVVGVKCSFGAPTNSPVFPASVTGVGAESIVSCGFQFGVGGTNTVRAYDNGSFFPGSAALDSFQATDEFYVQVQRDSIIGPNQNKFRIILSHGTVGQTALQAQPLYESSFVGPANGLINVSPIAIACGDGHELTNMNFISLTDDSRDQSDTLSNVDGVSFQGNIIIRSGADRDDRVPYTPTVTRFLNILGLNKYLDDAFNDYLYMSDTDQPINNALQLKWRRPLQILAKDCKYVIGGEDMLDYYTEATAADANDGNWDIRNTLSNLPRQLEVRLNNLTLKNFSGSMPNANNATGSFIEEGLNRIVGTVPTPQPNNVSNNVDWVIEYEPFTPVYRPLNNDQPFTVNQLNVEISYKDFQTNQRKTIDNIDGTLALEFHVKPMEEESKPGNNIRPY